MAGKARNSRARRNRLRGSRRIADSRLLQGIKQGVGQSVSRAFGSIAQPPRRNRRARRGRAAAPMMACHHDAFHPSHLPLPRAVGPYTVIRTTRVITTNYPLMTLGPKFDRAQGKWTNALGDGWVDVTKTPADTNNMYGWNFPTMTTGSWGAAQVTPAAFSVQIMNPNALQTTSGIVYGARLRTSWKINENLTTVGTTADQNFISFNNPRLMSAAKLAFRGVQIDAVPFNMADLATFTAHKDNTDGTFAAAADTAAHAGFAPIFISNPNAIQLQLLVCCEWRVRFDPSNPAQAAHVQHQAPPESVWQTALNMAEGLGNGVRDIADTVAATGNAVYGAMGSMYRAGRGARALTGAGMLALGL